MSQSTQQGSESLLDQLLKGPFGKLFLPAIVVQSVLVGGGYATGRTVVEYGAQYGRFGAATAVVIFLGYIAIATAVFEFARVFKAYDYKTFQKNLNWKLWPLYDLCFLGIAVLVISVVASASGNILEQIFGIPYLVGIVGIISVVGVLTYKGRRFIEKFKTFGTIALFGSFIAFAALILMNVGSDAVAAITTAAPASNANANLTAAISAGLIYVGYNSSVFSTVLFTLDRQTTRKETVSAGVIAGVFMIIPFALAYLCVMGFYPNQRVLNAPVPWLVMIRQTIGPTGVAVFAIVFGWTAIETGTGMIHAILDRVNEDLKQTDNEMFKDGLSSLQSAMLSIVILSAAVIFSRVGIIALVAEGYSLMAYGFIALLVIPLFTIGLYRIANPQWARSFWDRPQIYSSGSRSEDKPTEEPQRSTD